MNRYTLFPALLKSALLAAYLAVFMASAAGAQGDKPASGGAAASAEASAAASGSSAAPAAAGAGASAPDPQADQGKVVTPPAKDATAGQAGAKGKGEQAHTCEGQCELGPTGVAAILGTGVLFLGGIAASVKHLKDKDNPWKLSEALSEKSGVLAPAGSDSGKNDGKLVASSSRLIAFVGSIALLAVFFGFGIYILWAAFTGNTSQLGADVKAVGTYFLYGSALFTPYAFNQVKDAFK